MSENADEVWDYLNEEIELEEENDIINEVDSFEKIEESYSGTFHTIVVQQIEINQQERVIIIRDNKGEYILEYWEIDRMLDNVDENNLFFEQKIYCRNFRFLLLTFQSQEDYTKASDIWERVKKERFPELPASRINGEERLFMNEEMWRKEFTRQKVDFEKWSICKLNVDYSLCPTYPKYLLIPSQMTDEEIRGMTNFRSKGRVPATSYYYHQTSATISRCSQPLVGVFGSKRNEYDEKIIQLFGTLNKTRNQIFIMDCRTYLGALANKAKGAGTESTQYYENCTLTYANIENIHVMRESIYQLFLFTCIYHLDENALDLHQLIQKQLKLTWFSHLQLILAKSFEIAHRVKNGFSVLIHCTDGWDRTSQLSATSQLLIDPYFRTIEGFIVLIEKEWLSFGHKFQDRCHQEKLNMFEENEQSPVFLQWLDCIYQLTYYFPSSFEFNSQFLLLLADSAYSCKYRNFLYNTERDRVVNNSTRPCLWEFIRSTKNNYLNANYDPNSNDYLDLMRYFDIEFHDFEELKTDKIARIKIRLWEYYFRFNNGVFRTPEEIERHRANLEKVLELSVELQNRTVSPVTQITEFFSSFLQKSYHDEVNKYENEDANNNNNNNNNGSWGSYITNVIPQNFKFF